MKNPSVIVVSMFIGLVAGAGIAQDTNLEIHNETNTNKRICFYDAADKVAMIAFRCGQSPRR